MKFYIALLILVVYSQQDNRQISPEDQTFLETLQKDQFGLNVLNSIQTEYQRDQDTKAQLNRIEHLLNEIEQQIAQDQQNDLELESEASEQYYSQLLSLEEQIAKSQYDYSTIGAQIRLYQDESNRYDILLDEKENIIDEYQSLSTQLDEIRQQERDHFEIARDDSITVCNLLKRAKYLIKQLIPKTTVLVQQSTNINQDFQQNADFLQQINQLQREAQESLQNNQPFLKIITEFVNVSTQTEAVVNTKRVNAIVNLLQQLYDQIDKTSRVQYNAEDDRDQLHSRVKNQINDQLHSINLQLATLQNQQDSINAQIVAEQQNQKDEEKRLANLKQQLLDLSKCSDDTKVNYGVRQKERKEQLKLLRQVRQVMLNDFDAIRCYIEDYFNKAQR
ncbi:unnamed protein product (macronuclear) [Paramecium tetraurelia]|uniref:Trichocyst matrix protein n=1 Tax=Paramecium tetraurelia TaxID=5888 RepID=A0E284_PARTE|nr:uncharacterized protein GSPATT00022573001 [Paramecium tetraurelia]CAK89401.1 unnamed protein product [Paramecium tetraurelia]|eukprot:XP_001456798.1 hypothetical protein (macronuclear) [Paramecium tetraurelia strain d4-2]